MNARGALGLATAAVIFLSGLAHAFLGWPPLRAALEDGAVSADMVGALAVGWCFGSVAMLVFSLIVLLAALEVLRGGRPPTGPLWVVAVAYLAFGLTAFLSRDLNPHFLLFIATGVLVGGFAWWTRR